jgi:hypothetical protein
MSQRKWRRYNYINFLRERERERERDCAEFLIVPKTWFRGQEKDARIFLRIFLFLKQVEKRRKQDDATIRAEELNSDSDNEPEDDEEDEDERVDRIHCWVLLRKGARGLTEDLFIEPSTGRVYTVQDSPCAKLLFFSFLTLNWTLSDTASQMSDIPQRKLNFGAMRDPCRMPFLNGVRLPF